MVYVVKIASATLSLGSHIARQNTACPANPVCPANNGCISTATNGAKFQVACDTDYYGYDFQTSQASTYKDCLYACSVTQTCVAISYTPGICYLKNKVTSKPVHNTAVEGATLTGPSRASPTPIPRTLCTSPLKCPSTNNCIYAAGPAGLRLKPFVIACTTDFYGGDLSNAPAADMAACVNQCAVVGQCVAVSYKTSTKTCYLKKELKKGIYSTDVIGASVLLNFGGLLNMGVQVAEDLIDGVMGALDGGLLGGGL